MLSPKEIEKRYVAAAQKIKELIDTFTLTELVTIIEALESYAAEEIVRKES